MKRLTVFLALWIALPLAAETKVDRGIAVGLEVTPRALTEGDTMRVAFTLRDESGTPLENARPAAWLAPAGRDCTSEAARFLGGGITDRASVDFNNYYVLALNDDATISVVDPRFSFGGSQLLALVPLAGRGEDWALTPDGDTLYVSMPAAGKIAVIDTRAWKVRRNVDVGGAPSQVVLRDGRLWVVTGQGIAVIENERVLERRSGDAIAFDDRGNALVLDRGVIQTVSVAPRSFIAWSKAAQMLYAADPESGRVVAIRGTKVAASIDVEKGFSQLRFTPDGRYAFLPTPGANIVQVIDTASNRIVQIADIPDGPDQVTFTETLAYVRRRGSETVMMIPLQRIGAADSIGVADFTGGQHPLGAGRFPSLADSIVEAPVGPAVLVANPKDRSIYYYKEGMAAPMGGFKNGSREPRAVLVVDRSLRERSKGLYATTAVVNDPGKYNVVFFLDAPRVVTCFPVEVTERAENAAKRANAAYVEPLVQVTSAQAGTPAQVSFRIADAATRRTREAGAVEVVVMQAPGIWQRRMTAEPSSDGHYAIQITPPSAGTYFVYVASAAAGLPINNSHFMRFEVN